MLWYLPLDKSSIKYLEERLICGRLIQLREALNSENELPVYCHHMVYSKIELESRRVNRTGSHLGQIIYIL